MSFAELIKNSVINSFSTDLTAEQVLLSIGVAFVASLILLLVYRLTSEATVIDRRFPLTLSMTAMISAMIVTTITSNLALSLGMVGALSIVRFRTAVKNPIDTVYLFWAVAAGITAGAQAYGLCVLACAGIGIVVYFMSFALKAGVSTYILVVRTESEEAMHEVEKRLKSEKGRPSLASSTSAPNGCESVWELGLRNTPEALRSDIASMLGVSEVSVTRCSVTSI